MTQKVTTGLASEKNPVFRLDPRKYRKIPIISRCPYRKFIWKWWAHWLDPRTYYYDLEAFYQRGTRGWADKDCWSLDMYLSGWMGDALHHLQAKSWHKGVCDEKGIRDYTIMIEAWDGAYHYADSCDCLSNDPQYEHNTEHIWTDKEDGTSQLSIKGDTSYIERYRKNHTEFYQRRWDYGKNIFLDKFFSLWW